MVKILTKVVDCVKMLTSAFRNLILLAFVSSTSSTQLDTSQALGKYLWEDEKHEMNDQVLLKYDEALNHYVYKKLWSELSRKDKWYMSFIVRKESMETGELLELSGQKKNEFSQYRERLRDKGLINTDTHGVVSYNLPRFDVFVKNNYIG